MASLKEIVYNIQNLHSRFIQSDDNKLSDRQVVFIINYYRAKLIRQRIERGETISSFLLQDIKIPIGKFIECGEQCVLRSVDPLPKPVEGKLRDYLYYVGDIYGTTKFDELNYVSNNSVNYTKYSKLFPKYYVKERHLYIKFSPTINLATILVRGIFEDPSEAYNMGCITDADYGCFNKMEYDYPMSSDMVDTINKMIMEAEFKFAFSLPEDKLNDGANQ